MTNNERKSEYDRCAGNDGMHEDSLVEGMKELMPVYCVIGKIPVEQNRCAMACQGCGAAFFFSIIK